LIASRGAPGTLILLPERRLRMDEDDKTPSDLHLDLIRRPGGLSLMPGDVVAAGLSVVWILLSGGFFLAARQSDGRIGTDTLRFVVVTATILLPVALIWIAAIALRALALVREESVRLQAAADALRKAQIEMRQGQRLQVTPAAPDRRPSPAPLPSEPVPRPAPAPGAQASLALDAEPPPPLTSEELLRALHFPETTEDRAGFRALKRAMADPRTGRLLQAAEDVLTFLSQEGIYMDDLDPDRARPEIWRRFAQGERGGPIAMLGGVRDRTSIEKIAIRMRSDHIFRDTAHHFLRQFDKTFQALEPGLTDPEIAAISETRTFRAFMLIARVAGTFD